MIYIVKLRGHRPVKIGETDNVEKRMSNLQTSSPFQVDLLGLMPGSTSTEKQLHNKYQSYNVRGEWFNLPDHELESLLELAIL